MDDIEELIIINQVLEDLEEVEMQVRRRGRINALNAFDLSDELFIKNFRLTKNLVRELIELISPLLTAPSRISALSIETKVLTALHFFGHGTYQEGVGKHLSICTSQSSVSRCIQEVSTALNNEDILQRFIKFPQNIQEMQLVRTRFYRKFQFPGTVGCIDCTHVAIVRPVEDEHIYVNRKGYHSLNVQLVCDENLKIINCNPRFPGSSHDSFIWRQSNISGIMENVYRQADETFFLVGDSGYPLRPWLQTPINDPVPGTAEERFNLRFKSVRSTIERCNGVLKNRFRCLLKHRVLHYTPITAGKIVNACAILHNMCIDNNIPEPEDEQNIPIDYGQDNGNHIPFDAQDGINADLAAGRRVRQQIVNTF